SWRCSTTLTHSRTPDFDLGTETSKLEEHNYWRRCRGRYRFGLVVAAIVWVYRRRRSSNGGQTGNPQLDLSTPRNLTTPGHNEEGLAGTPAEKSEDAMMAQGESATTTLPLSPQGEFPQAVTPQAAQPQQNRALKPLPSPPLTQSSPPNNSDALEPQQHSPQLSPQQVRLVQELVDQGVPSSQVAGVVRSMLASGSSSNTNSAVAAAPPDPVGQAPDAPPEYDFKDDSKRGGL
ncbi:hypothetical protein FRC01_001142, partial [Tulasnella sp. 417]